METVQAKDISLELIFPWKLSQTTPSSLHHKEKKKVIDNVNIPSVLFETLQATKRENARQKKKYKEC